MRIALVTALWKRPGLTRIFLRHYAEMKVPGVDLLRVAAVSLDEDPMSWYPSPHIPAWYLQDVPNEPLSDKWTAALGLAHELGPDAILILGSDDFVDAAYIQRAAEEIQDHNLIIPQSLYFYSTERREMFYGTCSRGGPGRVLRRDLLEEVDWQPWELGKNVGLEGAMDRRLRLQYLGRPYRKLKGEDLTIIDVKTDENMWSYAHVRRMLKRKVVDRNVFLWKRLPGIADELLAMEGAPA